MTNFNDFLNEQMKDPEFKAEWDALDPEFSVIEAMLKAFAKALDQAVSYNPKVTGILSTKGSL